MLNSFATELLNAHHDVCIVGAGPAGIALALACEEYGLSVLLLESGHSAVDQISNSFSAGHEVDLKRHAPPEVAICRGLGGTSRWWGGRCVPFDDIDFANRKYAPESVWPVRHEDLSPWYPKAAAFFGIGSAKFHITVDTMSHLDGASLDDLERWAPAPNIATVYHDRLEASAGISVVMGATVTAIDLNEDGTAVAGLTIDGAGKSVRISPKRVVLACGGLETTRLLLIAQRKRPESFGGPNGALGRYYMGHLSGKIADIVFDDPDSASLHDFFLESGTYVRRRFTIPRDIQVRENLLNTAFWVDNPYLHATDHGNGTLSLIWLLLAVRPIGRLLASEGARLSQLGPLPHRWLPHILNVVLSPISTFVEITGIFRGRYLSSPAKPWFLIRSASGRYALHYHAEQNSNRESRVSLSQNRDALGLPFLQVALQFDESDADSVVRAHQTLDKALKVSGLGRLDFYDLMQSDQTERVIGQARDGYHQIGTTRMGKNPGESVVDVNCRAHGLKNLYAASSSVFASSSQANPTFLIVALALRLAEHLSRENCREV
jgi:choline dehydrogenase-like flavoprotein